MYCWMHKVLRLLLPLVCAVAMSSCRLEIVRADDQQTGGDSDPAVAAQSAELVIENEPDLPITYPQSNYRFRFLAHGGVSVLHWRLEKGALPPGLKLEDDGLLHGSPQRTGEFQFTVSVTDGSRQTAVQKGFRLRVVSALTLIWKNQARVSGNRIDGSVEVSNTTPDNMDLTFIVLAVAENGRATAIGYHHFLLPRGTIGKELPFGETLPPGGYVLHVDAVGEIAPKKLIYRERLQTAQMQVTVGP